jgi:uncharacterized membrane protein
VLVFAVAAAALAWAAALIAAPVLPVPIAGTLYAFCSLICHQLPARSFHVAGAQLPVCARCFGIYAGAAAALVAALPLVRSRQPSPGPSAAMFSARDPRHLIVAGAVPTAVTVILESAGIWSTSNVVRAATGALLGAALAWTLAQAVRHGRPAID